MTHRTTHATLVHCNWGMLFVQMVRNGIKFWMVTAWALRINKFRKIYFCITNNKWHRWFESQLEHGYLRTFRVCVVLCKYSLAMGRSPVQGILPDV